MAFLKKTAQSAQFPEGEIILVNKPLDWTSFDVVNKIRHLLKHKYGKKFKVGHAGTLDPLATGLVMIATGKATKQLGSFTGLDKSYSGTITLGGETDSYDLETNIKNPLPFKHITNKQIHESVKQFIGNTKQVPPIFSALKKDGKTMYKLARTGKKPQMEPRDIWIGKFDITRIELPEIQFDITCGKGTYIRSIAYDLGKKLKTGAYLSELVRTEIGDHKLEDAWEIVEIENFIRNLTLSE